MIKGRWIFHWTLITFYSFIFIYAQQNPNLLPSCTKKQYTSKKPTFALISYDSFSQKFNGNSNIGALDSASLLGVNLLINTRFQSTIHQMESDILNAIEKNVDGIITAIPNEQIYKAVEIAKNKRIPVIVFSVGESYASQLGLTRVLQQEDKLGKTIVEQLKSRGFSKPLAIHTALNNDILEIQSKRTIISNYLNDPTYPILLQFEDNQETFNTIYNGIQTGKYDSIISMGGYKTTDIVSNLVLRLRSTLPNPQRFGTVFIDLGGDNMALLIQKYPESTVAINQLPYYQTALPVFYLYLETITSRSVYGNQTIPTGPIVITNETLQTGLGFDHHNVFPNLVGHSNVSVLIPNTQGDTYGRNMAVGIQQLGKKIRWGINNVIQKDYVDLPQHVIDGVNLSVHQNISGIIVLSNSNIVAETAINTTSQSKIPLVLINSINDNDYNHIAPHVSAVNYDLHSRAKIIADEMVKNNINRPVCISERYYWDQSYFCDYFYDELSNPPPKNQVVHLVDITRQSNVDNDIALFLNGLKQQNYDAEAIITFSEYAFNSINMRILQNLTSNDIHFFSSPEIFNQKQAIIDGRIDKAWTLNTFSVGFISLLNIIINKHLPEVPWKHINTSASEVEYICPPGTFYTMLSTASFCLDDENDVKASFQCSPCPANSYNDKPDRTECQPCQNGTIVNADATKCISCYDPLASHSEYCSNYIVSHDNNKKQLALSIALPIALVILLLIIAFILWKLRKRRRYKKQSLGSDNEDTWLLSYNHLMFPSMRHLPSDYEQTQEKIIHPTSDISSTSMSSLSPARDNNNNNINNNNNSSNNNSGLLGNNIVDNNNQFRPSNNYTNTGTLQDSLISTPTHWALLKNGKSSKIKDIGKNESASPTNSNIALPLINPNSLYKSVGRYNNLYVTIKQIGFNPLKLDMELKNEIQLLKRGRCPNLSEFIGICIESHGTYLVEEYCRKGSLDKILANKDINLTWVFRFSLMNDLLQGMQFIHRSKINTHGLLTSASCMVTSRWELKISDYGLRKTRQTQYEPSVISTIQKHHAQNFIIIPSDDVLLWMAPESIVSIFSNLYITVPSKQADIYSIGIIMNEILTRSLPYKEHTTVYNDYKTIYQRIKEEKITPAQNDSPADYYSQINRLISWCWNTEPDKRPCIIDLKSQLHTIAPSLMGSDCMVENLALMLEKYANDMEDLVYKRTSNLLQRTIELEEERARTQTLLKDLKAAKEKAEAGARSKQNFLANMSHEIRTPMNAVIGMSHILMESDLPPELHDCVETIESSGNHLIAIIDDILDYSKIESGKLTLENKELDLSFVIESAIKLVAPNYLAKGIALWYTFDQNIPVKLIGDVVRLRQIILNLLSNALKFTPSGGQVSVQVKEVIQDQDYISKKKSLGAVDIKDYVPLQIAINDTGVGIPKDKINKLFKSFSQVDASTTRNFGGTGLGLAISRQLTRMMYGDMWVNSVHGEGSTFTFRVLLEKQDNSQTYGEQHELNEIVKGLDGMVVIAEQNHVSVVWKNILEYLNIKHLKILTFDQAKDYFNNQLKGDKIPILIVDADYAVIKEVEHGKNDTTTSQNVIIYLRNLYPELYNIPTICINDIRSKRQSAKSDSQSALDYKQFDNPLAIVSHKEILKGNDITPISLVEERNPFDLLTTILYKPLKNSILFTTLHRIVATSCNTNACTLNPSPSKLDSYYHQQNIDNNNDNRNSLDPCYFNHHNNNNNNRLSLDPSLFNKRNNKILNNSNPLRYNSSDEITHQSNRSSYLSSLSATSTLPNSPLEGTFCVKPTPSSVSLTNLIKDNDINILIVDDNPVNRKVLKRMLDKLGMSCCMAQDGLEAYNMVQKAYNDGKPFGLILMDIWMPNMNGFEATSSIRKLFPDSGIEPYIIALTACVTPDDRRKCKEAGMNGYVSKPVRKPELMAAINEFKQTTQVNSQNDNIPNQKDSIDTSPKRNEYKDITSLKKEPTLDITPAPPTVTITTNLTNRGKDDIDSRRP